MWNPPATDAPVGAICAYAGRLTPESTDSNNVFSCTGAAALEESLATAPTPDDATRDASGDGPEALIEASGWMVCDGRSLWVSKYPALYGALGTLYGSDGDGTFKIPDCRGLFLRGVDSGSGMDPDAGDRTSPDGQGKGSGVGSVQCDAVQDHVHAYEAAPPPSSPGKSGKSATSPGTATATGGPAEPNSVSVAQPDGTPIRVSSETRPRNIAVHYLIKFR